MSEWTRGDKLTAWTIVIGIVGIVASLWVAPTHVPSVAVLYKQNGEQHVGMSRAEATFQNMSYEVPVFDLEARWATDCIGLTLGRDGRTNNSDLSCVPRSAEALLRIDGPLPARDWIAATFTSPRPFVLPTPSVEAFQVTIDPTDISRTKVPVLTQEVLDTLKRKSYQSMAYSVSLAIAGVLLFYFIIRRTV